MSDRKTTYEHNGGSRWRYVVTHTSGHQVGSHWFPSREAAQRAAHEDYPNSEEQE